MVHGLIGKGALPTSRTRPAADCDLRAAFNQAFLPAIFYHTPQTETLKPGDFRKHVAMNVDVEIREATVWRMPTRESSKVRKVKRS